MNFLNITFKRFYKRTLFGRVVLRKVKNIIDYFFYHFVPEKLVVKIEFRKFLGYKLNLNNPQTFNEKLQWLKLNIRTPLHTLCTDKLAVRDYIKEKLGEEYLIPLIFKTYDPAEIIPHNLPDFPFIIKTNHDSSQGIIIYDKEDVNWESIQSILKKKLKINYYYRTKEWQYKNIKPCIIVEKLLIDEREKIPFDYKFHCFNQRVEMIQVDIDRNTKHQYRNWYNREWERESFIYCSPVKMKYPMDGDIPKPKLLDKMIFLSELLSDTFHYVRVDWYYVYERIYFGELTFTPGAGYSVFIPAVWDRYFGDKLVFSIK